MAFDLTLDLSNRVLTHVVSDYTYARANVDAQPLSREPVRAIGVTEGGVFLWLVDLRCSGGGGGSIAASAAAAWTGTPSNAGYLNFYARSSGDIFEGGDNPVTGVYFESEDTPEPAWTVTWWPGLIFPTIEEK